MAPNTPRPTKAQRREAARAQAKAMREEQARRERRATMTRRSLLGAGVLAAGGGIAYLVVSDRDSGKRIPKGVEGDGSWTYGADLTVGSANADAPVLDVFFDYSCHHCADFETLHSEEIRRLVNDGTISVALHPCQILQQEWTDHVMNAMAVVLNEQPGAALDFHNEILAFYTKVFAAQDASMLTEANIVSTAISAGVAKAVTDNFSAAIKDNAYGKWTELCTKTFRSRGFTGTPTVQFDGTIVDIASIATPTGLTDYIKSLNASATTEPEAAPTDEPTAEAAETTKPPLD